MLAPALREQVIALAQAAGDAIMQVYAQPFEVAHKADASPLTQADLASHRCIVARLNALTPQWPVLSEEAADFAWEQRRQWNTYWLVDPLDGTREFIKRNGEFSVNIALIDHGRAVFGVVQQPVGGALWHASVEGPAYRRDEMGEREIQTTRPAPAALRVAASRSHRDARTEAVLAKMGVTETVGLGSSLKFCRIAEGELDVYPRFGPTSEWDTAAAQCVLEAAGGALLAPSGRPFQYNQRASLLNGDFVALGDPALPWQDWL